MHSGIGIGIEAELDSGKARLEFNKMTHSQFRKRHKEKEEKRKEKEEKRNEKQEKAKAAIIILN
jgi:hypothetical protein